MLTLYRTERHIIAEDLEGRVVFDLQFPTRSTVERCLYKMTRKKRGIAVYIRLYFMRVLLALLVIASILAVI